MESALPEILVPATLVGGCPPSNIPGGRLMFGDCAFQVYSSTPLEQTTQVILASDLPALQLLEEWKKTTHRWLLRALKDAAAETHGIALMRSTWLAGQQLVNRFTIRCMVIACVLPLEYMPYTDYIIDDILKLPEEVDFPFSLPTS